MPCGTPTNWAVITFLLQIFWNSPFTIHMFWDLVISFPNSTWYFSDSQCLWIYLLFVFVFPSIVHHFTSSERILHHVPVISTIAGAGDAAQAAAAAAQEWNGAGIDEGIADGDATGHGCCNRHGGLLVWRIMDKIPPKIRDFGNSMINSKIMPININNHEEHFPVAISLMERSTPGYP